MQKITEEDYYKILGVARSATEQDVNKAYKKLAVKYHPDKNPDNKEMAEENFKKVSEAYEVLSNSEKRQTYDTVGKAGLGGGGGMPGGNFSQADAEAMFSQVFGGQDPFSVLFGEMGGGRGMGRGAGGPGMQFHFGGMPGGMGGMGGMPGPSGMGGGMGGMGGGMGGMPDLMQMLGGMQGMQGMPGMGGMGGMGGMPGGMGGMPAGRGGRRRTRERPDLLPDGTRVTVRGLQGAAQHNGKSGEVHESSEATGRYTVQLDDGEVLRIKPDNLLQSCSAELTGMERKPELNGREGRVTGWDASGGRYHVSLDGQVVSLKPDNLILPPGARATVIGLVSQPRWNGSTCKVVSFDRERRRYTVQMKDESTHLALKLESLRL